MFDPQTPTTIHLGLGLALAPWSLKAVKVLLTVILVGLGTLAIGKPLAQLWVPRSPSAQKTVVTMVNTLGFLIGAWVVLRILL
jgi:hypothetical protein